jgi:CubicO group peptidase (beta-lactamase class C family)
LGYVILGQLIEAINNISFEDYIRENILDDLVLKHDVLGFEIPHANLHATGYHNKRSLSMLLLRFLMNTKKYMGVASGKWKPFNVVFMNGTSYGGLIANNRGIIKYAQELLKDESLLISAENKKLLFTENKTNDNKPTGMCLSWYKGITDGQTYFTHAGGGGGYYCELRLYPDIHSGSFIIFNRSGFSDERFLNHVDGEFLKDRSKQILSSSVIS